RSPCLDFFFSVTELGRVLVMDPAQQHDVALRAQSPLRAILSVVELNLPRRPANPAIGSTPLTGAIVPLPNVAPDRLWDIAALPSASFPLVDNSLAPFGLANDPPQAFLQDIELRRARLCM